MTVKDLIEKLSACPPECRVLVLLGGELVGDVKGMEVAPTLEDYPCSGFDDAFVDFEELYDKKVVILT